MKQAIRVSGPVPILDEQYRQDGSFVSGSTLPYHLDSPAEIVDGMRHAKRYYLTIIDGNLYYLHESAQLYAAATVPVTG